MLEYIAKPVKAWFSMPLWGQILIALVLGMATGLLGGPKVEAIQFIGLMFINAIQMLVVPVVFTAIVCAVISIDQIGKMKKVISKAMFMYALCMALAATIGILSALLIAPGSNLTIHLPHTGMIAAQTMPTFTQVLVNFIPTSPVAAFATNNVIQILIFAILLGIAIRLTGEPAKPVADFFNAFSKVSFRFAKLIISFAPYGVFALITYVFGKYGMTALLPLFKFIAAVYLGCMMQIVLVYGSLLAVNRINPWHFIKAIFDAIVLAYTTSSSVATLPVSFKCAQENLNISKNLSGFLLPLGTSFNLNGLSIYLSTATIFAANLYGIHLGMTQYATIVLTIVFTAMGAAAVPGSALVVMGAVMSSVGIPLGALPLIAGVDRFNDMAQTATNVIGDLFVTAVVAKGEDKNILENEIEAITQAS